MENKTITVDAELWDVAQEIARKQGLSMSELVRKKIAIFVSENSLVPKEEAPALLAPLLQVEEANAKKNEMEKKDKERFYRLTIERVEGATSKDELERIRANRLGTDDLTDEQKEIIENLINQKMTSLEKQRTPEEALADLEAQAE